MENPQVFETVSERTGRLLDSEENYEIEFKQSVTGLDSSDLVAFANSEHGGTILIGVKEVAGRQNRQRGRIIGCDVGDQERLNLLSKAASCLPKIEMEIFVENLKDKPFFRIEIPPGRKKPYCTSGGTYKIRGYGLNETLDPDRLLAMFIESENDQFLKRFTESTRRLERHVEQTNRVVVEEIERIAEETRNMKRAMVKAFENMGRFDTEGPLEASMSLRRLETKIDLLLKQGHGEGGVSDEGVPGLDEPGYGHEL